MERKRYNKGDVIIQEGTVGTCAYIVVSGKVEISSFEFDKKSVHSLLGNNQIFGEMGVLVDEPRPHTVIAIEDTVLEIVSRDNFSDFFLNGDASILSVLSFLLERLRVSEKKSPINQMPSFSGDDFLGEVVEPSVEPFKEFESFNDDEIIDNRYIIFSGANELSCDVLKSSEVIINKFPFKVGRFTIDNVEKVEFDTPGKNKKNVLAENDLYLYEEGPNYYISAAHFMIDKTGGVFSLTDRGSRLGVIVNDLTVKGSCLLKNKNTIIIGSPYSPFLFNIEVKGDLEVKKKKISSFQTVKSAGPEFEVLQ